MNSLAPDKETSLLPRAAGQVRLRTKKTERGTALDTLFQKGALKAVFPHGPNFTAVMVNTSGGVTGGDRFHLTASAGPGSQLTLTTQAAERAYKALPGEVGKVRTQLAADAGSRLWWLPQETILFDGANFARHLRCDLDACATALLVEPLILGRAAMGETRVHGCMSEQIDILRDGALIYRDAWKLDGDLTAHFLRPGIGKGATAMASLVLIGPGAETLLEPLREHLADAGSASLREQDLLVARVLARDGYALRKRLVPALSFLTQNTMPTCWRL